MRLHRTRIKGFGPFSDVTLDLDALPQEAQFVALCGDNGEGKSTLIDLLVDGSHWREWPRVSGAKLDYVATGRDSLLETVSTIGGKTYTMRHLVDRVSGKGESAVYLDGEPLIDSGKAAFNAFAKDNFPAKSVVRSSIVSHPAYGSFVTMKPTSRKEVILLALGVEGIEKLAAAARKRRDVAVASVESQRKALSESVAAANVCGTEQELACREHELHSAGFVVAEARSALDVARQLAGDSALARQRYIELKDARDELEAIHASTLRELSATKATLADIAKTESEAKTTMGGLVSKREALKKQLDEVEASARLLGMQRDAAQRQLEDRHRVQLELRRATGELDELRGKISKYTDARANAGQIREAVAKTSELKARVAEADVSIGASEVELRTSTARIKETTEKIACTKALRSDLALRIGALEKSLSQAPAVEAAAAKLEGLEATVARCRLAIESTETELGALRGKHICGADERIDGLRRGLRLVMSDGNPCQVAELTLAYDDAAVSAAVEIRDLISKTEGEQLPKLHAELDTATVALRTAEALARFLPRVVVEREALAEAQDRAAKAATEYAQLVSALADERTNAARIESEAKTANAARSDALDEIAKLEPLTSRASALAAADTVLAELAPSLEATEVTVARLTEELDALPEPEAVPADPDAAAVRRAIDETERRVTATECVLAASRANIATLEPIARNLRVEADGYAARLQETPEPCPPEAAPDVSELEQALALAQEEHTAAAQCVGAAKAALDTARAAEAKAEALRATLTAAEVEASDWTRLATDLGRKGLQAALVDSAGPELTRVTNDLLHNCFGTRWTVSYETQRVNGSGDVSEAYDVRIIDTERGRDGVVEDLSDGERTIIASAASLALAELACKSAGFEEPTLFFDESSAALSAERRPMWLSMIRRAAKHVSASRVIVVSHSKDLQDLCDLRIRVADGNLVIGA